MILRKRCCLQLKLHSSKKNDTCSRQTTRKVQRRQSVKLSASEMSHPEQIRATLKLMAHKRSECNQVAEEHSFRGSVRESRFDCQQQKGRLRFASLFNSPFTQGQVDFHIKGIKVGEGGSILHRDKQPSVAFDATFHETRPSRTEVTGRLHQCDVLEIHFQMNIKLHSKMPS